MHVVVLDHQVIAAEPDGEARRRVDQIVRCAQTAASHTDADALFIKHADVMDVIVVRVIACGSQRRAVAAAHHDRAAADLVNVIARDAIV